MTKPILFVWCALSVACSASGLHAGAPRAAEVKRCAGGVARSNAELTRYEGCARVDGDLAVVGVTSVNALASLEQVTGKLRIENTERLYSLAGLESLRGARELTLRNNARLISGDALRNLTQVGRVTISENPRLSAGRGLLRGLSQSGAEVLLEHNAGLAADGLGNFHPVPSRATLAQR